MALGGVQVADDAPNAVGPDLQFRLIAAAVQLNAVTEAPNGTVCKPPLGQGGSIGAMLDWDVAIDQGGVGAHRKVPKLASFVTGSDLCDLDAVQIHFASDISGKIEKVCALFDNRASAAALF